MQFREITDDSESVKQSLINNYIEWGGSLSLESYLEREHRLDALHRRNNLNHRVFAVFDAQNKVIGACETLSRPLYRGGGARSVDHCFASVFVVKEHRKSGVCANMIQKTLELFENPEEQLSLWSDVGDYYSRFGFAFPQSFEDEPHWRKTIVCHKVKKGVECEYLDQAKVNSQVLAEHANEIIRHSDSIYMDCNGEVEINTVLPSLGLYEQLQFRAIYTAEKLNLVKPTRFGARTLDSHGWVSWTFFFDSKKMMILGLFGSTNEIAILLAAATAEAVKWGCCVELYEASMFSPFGPAEEAALTTLGLEFEIKDRESSLPMSKGPGIWIYPGGYGWY